jgi:hypothetical protein
VLQDGPGRFRGRVSATTGPGLFGVAAVGGQAQPGVMFDLHVHAAPDVDPRAGDDTTVADWYEAAGYSGFVLKGHYESTVGRAAEAGTGRRVRVYGGIALNAHVGGFNPHAVAAALQMGARVVWMPTTDAAAHQRAGLPRLWSSDRRLHDTTFAAPPLDWSTEPALRLILDLIAEADAVLATGHLSGAEIAWLLTAARHAGVRRILLTHPGYTVPNLGHTEVAEFADQGAAVEVTAFQLLHQPDCDASRLAALIRAAGTSRVVLSSDAGQPDSRPPPEALAGLLDALAVQGLDSGALAAMSGEQPEQLVTP